VVILIFSVLRYMKWQFGDLKFEVTPT